MLEGRKKMINVGGRRINGLEREGKETRREKMKKENVSCIGETTIHLLLSCLGKENQGYVVTWKYTHTHTHTHTT